MPRTARPASPADLVALALRVQHDERATRADRLAESERLRDLLAKKTQEQSQSQATDPDRLLWLIDHPGEQHEAISQQSRQARSALALVGLILVVLGLLSGLALAAAVFYYDGSAPVNVVAVLGVFVVLQMLLLMLAGLAALPRGWVGRVPGMDGVQEALRLASPGRLAFLGARLLPQEMREALFAAVGRSGAHQRVYGRVQLWAILRWSQLYAAALHAAAIATFLYLVFFSDLAFGWSTTLEIDPSQFHQAVHTLALPWAWQDTLTPSLELVERSRYFRGTPFEPEQRGAWWPFLFTAMLVYGLLPRIISFIVSSICLQRATRHALTATPGALSLLRGLDGQASAADSNTDATAGTVHEAETRIAPNSLPAVIDWSRAAGSAVRVQALLGFEPVVFESAGGSRTVADDRALIETIGKTVADDGVVLLVKLWEPPVIETTEFLRELRVSIGERLPIRVVPIASDASGNVIGDGPVLVEQWKRRVDALGDPWCVVAEPVGGTVAQGREAEAGDG